MRPTLIAVFVSLFLYTAFNLLFSMATHDNPDTPKFFIFNLINSVILFNLIYNPNALNFINKPRDPPSTKP